MVKTLSAKKVMQMNKAIGCNNCENLAVVDMTEAQEDAPLKFCPFCGSDNIEVIDDE